MAHTHPDWSAENERLQRTIFEVDRQLDELRKTTAKRRADVVSTRTSMWEEARHLVRDFDDVVELTQAQGLLDQREREYAVFSRRVRQLERLLESPYFGRIDFRPQGADSAEPYYIGLSSLVVSETGRHLVYDWRAPISAMFYDYGPGPAGYRTEKQDVRGEMTLKRQYKIERGDLVYFFDTDLTIDDEMLRDILGRSADQRMKVIVQSIQAEQNRVIRNEDHRVLVVEGPAGSGKTSIALHRVAYLLYRHRRTIQADQIVVVSPNRIFTDYISDVLPNLGEENMRRTTFSEMAAHALGEEWTLEDMGDQLEQVFAGGSGEPTAAVAASVGFKTSPAFLTLLKKYVEWLEEGCELRFEDVSLDGKVIVRGSELVRSFRERYDYLPYVRRIEKAIRRVFYLLEPIIERRVEEIQVELYADPEYSQMSKREIARRARLLAQQEMEPIKERVSKWGEFDVVGAYARIFEDRTFAESLLESDSPAGANGTASDRLPAEWDAICRRTLANLKDGRIAYEDAAPLLFLGTALGTVSPIREIRHVVVDESQDYSPCHYEAMRRMYPSAAFTILGDGDQAIHPYSAPTAWETMRAIFGAATSARIRLTRSYRSTKEIMEFARALLPGQAEDAVEPVSREGEKPLVAGFESREALNRRVAADIKAFLGEGHRSVAVICKTAEEGRSAREALEAQLGNASPEMRPHLLTKDDEILRPGVSVLPGYLAKGLEFDAVIIYDAGKDRYPGTEEQRLLYTACTRALHRLRVYYVANPSPLVRQVDADRPHEAQTASRS